MKAYRFLFVLATLLFAWQPSVQAQYAAAGQGLSTSGYNMDNLHSVTDAAGNTYVSGSYNRNFNFLLNGHALVPVAPTNNNNAFLAKLDPNGRCVWALAGASSAGAHYVTALTVSPTGDVYLVLNVGASNYPTRNIGFTFGTSFLTNAGSYLARVSPAGTVLALNYLSQAATAGSGTATVTSITADAAGNCYLALVSGPNGLGSVTPNPVPVGTAAGLIIKATPTAALSLVCQFSPTVSNSGVVFYDMKAGPRGSLYCTGYTRGTVNFGGSPLISITTNSNVNSGFVAKVDSTGTTEWALANTNTNGTVSSLINTSLAVNSAGEVYVSGTAPTGNFAYGGIATGVTGQYLVKFSAAGAVQWLRSAVGSYRYSSESSLVLDAAGNVYQTGVFNQPTVSFGTFSLTNTIPGPNQSTSYPMYLVSYDANGNCRWARTASAVSATTPAGRFYGYKSVNLGSDAAGRIYLVGESRVSATFTLRFDQQVVPSSTFFVRFDPAAQLSGTLYVDQNANGVRDTGEVPFPNSQVVEEVATGRTFNSDPITGEYNFYGPPASAYSLTVPSPRPYYTLSVPTTRTGGFPALGQTTSGLDFGLVPTANQTDLRLTLTPYNNLRAGFTSRYRVTVENLGTTTVASATATATLDARAAYVSSTPAGTYTAATRTVAWNITNLAPFAQASFNVQFSLPTNVTVGTQILTSAAVPVSGDVTPANNSDSDSRAVTGSFDPNDIQVNYTRITPTQVAAGLPLDYTVRFQNTGSDTAFAVVIQDTLNFCKLNLGTLQLVAQSHNCAWSLSGQGLLTIRFLGIKLPERNVDVIRSQGFVRFRVLPKSSLVLGDVITNRAHITFDFNAPVRTNTVTTTVLAPAALLNNRAALAWDTYPNPAQGLLTIAAELPSAGPVTLQLFDGLGRPVQQHTLVVPAGAFRQTLDVSPQAPGLYVLRLRLPDGTVLTRQVVRE